ncbi:hypothetical protein DMUE_5983 [Dictyocoela muelleri]|nr:hypothetical protein DMUE_5983 [Dictyocoela muelleri]
MKLKVNWKLKQASKINKAQTSSIVTEVTSKIDDSQICQIQQNRSLRQIVERAQKNEIFKSNKQNDDILKVLQYNLRNENFLIQDTGINDIDRIIIFQSNYMNEVMKRCKIFIIDGTFKSVTNQFTQLIVINAFLFGRTFTVAFILCCSKIETTYIKIFETLSKKQILNLKK